MGVESQTGVRRDFGDVRGLEPPLTTVMPTSPIRAEYYHRSTQTHYVVAGTTIYKKTGTEAFQRVMNPDGTSIAVVPGSGIVRIVPFDNAIVIQAD